MGSVMLTHAELRARFATMLSQLYGQEVPAYNTLVEVSREVNERSLRRKGPEAERFGSIRRVTAERHGAIRVGSSTELAQVARVFGALGMRPCGFYDLRDAHPRPIPVVSTAFRPVDRAELAANPFRVFTSMLVPEDRRFFDADLQARVQARLQARTLFPGELLVLADQAVREGGLAIPDAQRFLALAGASFALSREPVDRGWYEELATISDVAADIAGVSSTHINHLTPRVLDIDDLYRSMQAHGIEMIERIQGPPRWDGPDILLRQTSFRALAEPRRFREPDGTLTTASLRVRFGEVEARGIAVTAAGRDRYEAMTARIEERCSAEPDLDREQVAEEIWSEQLPHTEYGLWRTGLGYFTFERDEEHALTPADRDACSSGALDQLIRSGAVELRPIVYEDFLPKSAAGIFASNLTGAGNTVAAEHGAERDQCWMSAVLGQDITVPEDAYAEESRASLRELQAALSQELGVRCPPLHDPIEIT